jgi:hypothetical protein|tara:strand:- start:587 stop:886 length:300 start_codon:yes stop_codon:yes gene_type:complete
MAIRGLEGNQNAQPRVFAHDALDLKPSAYTLGDRIPNTSTIGVALYIGTSMDVTVTLEGGSTVLFKGVTAGSFLPVLVTHVTATSVTLAAGGGEIIALY